jgi:hypothetical protein
MSTKYIFPSGDLDIKVKGNGEKIRKKGTKKG